MLCACAITLTDEDRATLERWSRSRSTEARLVERARIVLLAAEGQENKHIATELLASPAPRLADGATGLPDRACRYRKRCSARRTPGGGPRRARPKIIEMTTQQKPTDATHWSTRTLAKELGTNRAMVNRVWRANGLKPHLFRTFKLSNDPSFAEKLVDVVGLYLNPPEHALVLCVDEKSQIQALDRTQPGLPM